MRIKKLRRLGNPVTPVVIGGHKAGKIRVNLLGRASKRDGEPLPKKTKVSAARADRVEKSGFQRERNGRDQREKWNRKEG